MKDFEANIHWLLSSFAVVNQDDQILNVALYIESGIFPVIHPIVKHVAAEKDVSYGRISKVFSQTSDLLTPISVKGILSKTGTLIPTGSVFEVETKGGARYFQAVDICLSHLFGHSLNLYRRQVKGRQKYPGFLPSQIDHCITSNTFGLRKYALITPGVLHVDSKLSLDNDYLGPHSCALPFDDKTLSGILNDKYPEMTILTEKNHYVITSPPFGASYKIAVLDEQSAGFNQAFLEKIRLQNRHSIANQFLTSSYVRNRKEAMFYRLFMGDRIAQVLLLNVCKLEKALIRHCRVPFSEQAISPELVDAQNTAKKILASQFVKIKSIISKKQNTALFSLMSWHSDLKKSLHTLPKSDDANQLKSTLLAMINKLPKQLKYELGISFEAQRRYDFWRKARPKQSVISSIVTTKKSNRPKPAF